MAILLGTNHLRTVGGTETWTYEMHRALSRHAEVHVKAMDNAYPWDYTPFDPDTKYEAAIVNHISTMSWVLENANVDKTINVIHGVIPLLESPHPDADVYVGVSEETAEQCLEFDKPVHVIRNPIDTERFIPKNIPSKNLKSVMHMSNTCWDLKAKLPKMLPAGVSLKTYGGEVRLHPSDVPEAMNRSDLVIGLGRTALEAMACGRNVIVAGRSGVDGFLDAYTAWFFRYNNMSGRFMQRPLDTVEEFFDHYDPDIGASNRQYVLENNSSELIAQKFLELV